jgi:outer membrane receptor protein involved in Fe transport
MRYFLHAFVVSGLLCAGAAGQTAAPVPPQKLQTTERVTVTATRGLTEVSDDASSTALLTPQDLANAPGLTLDDRLHQIAGFTLFRRTASWTANPTTEGVSLRGLGSTAASRTLVVSDQVPLNDPFGGWVHWNEIPSLAIGAVTLVRGGAADLYGSSAIGGVIDVTPRIAPGADAARGLHAEANIFGATQNSASGDGLLTAQTHAASALGALSVLSTGGYVPTAPAFRGAVDTLSNVTSQAARLEARALTLPGVKTAFLRGNLLNETRANGTPLQVNGTRLWRYGAGTDFDVSRYTGSVRLFGARETYRQSFSSVATDRNSEKLTRLQQVPTDEFGFAAQLSQPLRKGLAGALGLDMRDVRATDNETAVANSVLGLTTSISARQRAVGGFAVGALAKRGTTLSGSIRVDSFRTLAAQQTLSTNHTATPLPEIDELVADPHVGLSQYVGRGVTLRANAFRAFRGPTMNELYRTGQVGAQTTLANNALLAERATGFEFGAGLPATRFAHIDASYFWTEVNRPISAVLLSQTATTQTLQRQNLGQIRSRGVSLEARTARARNWDGTLTYQLAFATVTAFNSSSPVQANLTGNWIPQVPRQSVAATANYSAPHIAALHLVASYTGRQFDDAANQYVLHPYARIDLGADRALPHGFTLFAAAQNLLDRSIDAGRTPLLTLAAPRMVQAGIRWTSGR